MKDLLLNVFHLLVIFLYFAFTFATLLYSKVIEDETLKIIQC